MRWWSLSDTMKLMDKLGRPFAVGQTVIKGRENGHVTSLDFRKVVRIEDGLMYLDGVKQVAIRYPSRMLIWDGAVTA